MSIILSYWIYFERAARPEKIIANSWEELKEIVDRMVIQNCSPYEWMMRIY